MKLIQLTKTHTNRLHTHTHTHTHTGGFLDESITMVVLVGSLHTRSFTVSGICLPAIITSCNKLSAGSRKCPYASSKKRTLPTDFLEGACG